MTDEAIKELTTLEGVGKSKAKLLYDAGYASVEALKDATIEEIASVKGIGDKLAEKIKKSADTSSVETGAEDTVEEETVEKIEEEVEAEPVKKIEIPHVTITLDDETKRLLDIRKKQKMKKPVFKRTDSHKKKKLNDNWRRPRGLHNKKRIGIKGKGSLVQAGYGSPAAVRGLHPSGFEEVIINNPGDLDSIKAETQAARIARTVGGKKRVMILEKAVELGLKILNPGRNQ